MQARLGLPLLALLSVVAVLLLVPILQGVSRDATSDLELSRRDVLDQVAIATRTATETGDLAPLERYLDRYHDLFGEGILVLDANEEVVASVGSTSVDDPRVQRRTRDFGYNIADLAVPAIRPWSPTSEVLSRPVDLGGEVASGAVILEVDQSAARQEVRTTWAWVVLVALAALGLLALLTRRAVRWVLKPVDALEGAALALAAGDEAPGVVASGPPEMRRLARAFGLMSSALSMALQQQRDLVSRTSHQLRNPLAAVRLQTDLMGHGERVDPARLAAVQDGLDRLDQTIDRLLGLAEAEHHVMTARAARLGDPSVFDAEAQQASGADLARHLASRWAELPGLRLDVDPTVVLGLPEAELAELVDTVVDNAVKYAGPAAVVGVQLHADDDGATIVVEDDGEGLSDEEIERAGERFWRSSRHAEQPGSGLGLAIVDAICRAAGGTMEVRRSDLGGLAVAVTLPRWST